jgi:hypothetical protein
MARRRSRSSFPTTSPHGKPGSGRWPGTTGRRGQHGNHHLQGIVSPPAGAAFPRRTRRTVLSAVVHNDHDSPKTVKVSLELEGDRLEAIDGEAQTVEIAARSEARIDWRVKALQEGEATIRMRADAGDDGDAVERKLPVLVHGMSAPGRMEPLGGSGRGLGAHPDGSAGGAPAGSIEVNGSLLADHRRSGGRCDSLSCQLSARLHRADAQPLRSRGDRAAHAQGSRHQPRRSQRPSAPTSTRRNSATPPTAPRSGNNGRTTRSSMRRKWRRWSPPAWTS